MRVLVVCAEGCKRQYDASELAPGSRFHCACGEILTVPRLQGFEAAVIRCSACGAPRQGSDAACRHCQASFTLIEQDLTTVCPSCMARISDRARFCHHCATPLAAEGVGGEESSLPCPVCRGEVHLVARALGNEALSMMECRQCGGMWLGKKAFELLEEKAQAESVLARPAASAGSAPVPPQAGAGKIEYRPCPSCRNLMNRQNYGRRSGVIIDTCSEHGIWFDNEELTRILLWVRQGGLSQAKALQAEQHRAAARDARRAKMNQGSGSMGLGLEERSGWVGVSDVLGDVFTSFF